MPTIPDTQIDRVRSNFLQQFGRSPELTVRAPGRVNLIGEHTDYNEGYVFPVAIDREVVVAAHRRDDRMVKLYSNNYEQSDSFSLDRIEHVAETPQAPTWSNYVRGVVKVLQDAGHALGGFEAVLEGNVPQGAGLSSSAALEVAIATLLNGLFGLEIEGRDIALLSQRAENQFVGLQCGIMDQFISALGQRDRALMIDCRSLDYRAVPLHLGTRGASIVIIDSGVKRGLVDSKFNERRSECQAAVDQLRTLQDRPELKSLREVTSEDLEVVAQGLSPVVRARARHVISENERVLQGVQALQYSDLERFGELMDQSHFSLRDDYEVSTPELDRLTQLCREVEGTYGSRMTGAGFGGCTVSLVDNDSVGLFQAALLDRYHLETGRTPTMFVCAAVDGAGKI